VLRRVAEIFEAGDPFRSWWYALALLFAGGAGLAACVEGVHALGRRGLHLGVRVRVELPTEPARVEALLQRGRRRVRLAADGAVLAEGGRLSLLGPIVAGAGALALVGGAALGALASESGTAVVTEGATTYGFSRRTGSGPARFDLGLELSAERPSGAERAAPAWRLALARGADVLAQTDLRVGEELEHDGRRYQLEEVRPGRRPGRFLLAVGDGPARPVALGERLVTGDGTEVEIVAWDPSFGGRHGPAAQVVRHRKGGRPETGWLFARLSDWDERVRRSRPALRLEGYEAAHELRLRVERPAGRGPVALGAFAIFLGLVFLVGPPYNRIEARARPGGWELRAQATRGLDRLAREMDELAAAMRKEAG
jgi:hypothetical protein